MKPNAWRAYAGTRPFSLMDLPLPGRPVEVDAGKERRIADAKMFWDCRWCGRMANPVGLSSCEKCGMPK